ncbi:hypothetical protein FJZ18_00330 [Candidatus Pacearchaeota archaeon]|nr:hypothetical protein [Candidatus Pacearchaeota archaeon]
MGATSFLENRAEYTLEHLQSQGLVLRGDSQRWSLKGLVHFIDEDGDNYYFHKESEAFQFLAYEGRPGRGKIVLADRITELQRGVAA